jgi:hypothetical protein
MSVWAERGAHVFGAAERLAETDVSGSRFGIWSNAWTLAQQNPWFGVGWGNFNFAWSLTPFPHRPPAFFDHTHNLVLQLVVEMGVPLGLLAVGLLLWALWQAFDRAFAQEGPLGVHLRAAFVMVLLVAIHSMLEYPLWYAYFLLPTAWLWGCCLGAPGNEPIPQQEATSTPAGGQWWNKVMGVAGLLMVAGSIWGWSQYMTVSAIFEPATDSKPLAERIAKGQHTILFAHHADYAAVTIADNPADEWPAFRRATHYLLDTRLMIAWSKAFAARGDLDRARHIAQRLREFNNPNSAEFFAPCDHPKPGDGPKPYQCEPPSRYMDWRDFKDIKY